MVDDPSRGRVLLLAPEREPVLTRSGAEWMPSFIALLQRKLTEIADPAHAGDGRDRSDRRIDGPIHRLPERQAVRATREQFVDYCTDMLLEPLVTDAYADACPCSSANRFD